MPDLVINEKESYVSVKVAPGAISSITLTPPPANRVVVSPKTHQAITVTQEGDVSVRVIPAARPILSVTQLPKEKTLVVTGGRAVKATSIAHLNDVDISNLVDGASLVYDQSLGRWVTRVDNSLDQHINSETPHPAYDSPDGPSLVLLYQNAKV